jgi:PilZ domain
VTDQRKAIRFDLKLPVELIRAGAAPEPRIAETRNLSSNGVLFIADIAVPVGETIEYFITLPVGQAQRVRLRCVGKVVRHDGSNGMAATLERYEFVRN